MNKDIFNECIATCAINTLHILNQLRIIENLIYIVGYLKLNRRYPNPFFFQKYLFILTEVCLVRKFFSESIRLF